MRARRAPPALHRHPDRLHGPGLPRDGQAVGLETLDVEGNGLLGPLDSFLSGRPWVMQPGRAGTLTV